LAGSNAMSLKFKAMKKKYTFRKFINDVHLWLGLPSAIILVVMCFTGTLYVFQKEITQWVDRDKYTIEAGGRYLAIADLTTKVETEKKGTVTSIQIPQLANEAWTFNVAKKGNAESKTEKPTLTKDSKKNKELAGSTPKKDKDKSYWVNPYNGKVISDAQTPTSEFFATVLKLHRWLLIENHDIGGAITGTAALMMLLLQITGIILWAPAKLKSWKKFNVWEPGFKIKFDAKFKRVNFDAHKALGFYAFLFVTIMAITGPYFAFNWYKTSFASLMGTKPISKEISDQSVRPGDGSQRIDLETVLKNVRTEYPYAGTTRITFPKDSAGVFAVQKYASGFIASSAVDKMTLDQYSGKKVGATRFDQKTLGEKIIASAKLLHTGELFGTFSKILYFLACLIATSLPITGFLIWWGKNNKTEKTVSSARKQCPVIKVTA